MLRAALSMRLVMLVAAFGTGIGALVMFWQGVTTTVHAVVELSHGDNSKLVTAAIMGATDIFLFGIVLVIFTYTIVFGFVFKLPKPERRKLPAWMRPTGMHELKTTLIGAILVYLTVDFATDWAELGHNVDWSLLVKPISILLLAAALRLFANEPSGDDDQSSDNGHHAAPSGAAPAPASAPLHG